MNPSVNNKALIITSNMAFPRDVASHFYQFHMDIVDIIRQTTTTNKDMGCTTLIKKSRIGVATAKSTTRPFKARISKDGWLLSKNIPPLHLLPKNLRPLCQLSTPTLLQVHPDLSHSHIFPSFSNPHFDLLPPNSNKPQIQSFKFKAKHNERNLARSRRPMRQPNRIQVLGSHLR